MDADIAVVSGLIVMAAGGSARIHSWAPAPLASLPRKQYRWPWQWPTKATRTRWRTISPHPMDSATQGCWSWPGPPGRWSRTGPPRLLYACRVRSPWTAPRPRPGSSPLVGGQPAGNHHRPGNRMAHAPRQGPGR